MTHVKDVLLALICCIDNVEKFMSVCHNIVFRGRYDRWYTWMRFARISTLDICKLRSGYVTSHKNSIIREQYTSQFKLFSYTRSFVSYIFLEGLVEKLYGVVIIMKMEFYTKYITMISRLRLLYSLYKKYKRLNPITLSFGSGILSR